MIFQRKPLLIGLSTAIIMVVSILCLLAYDYAIGFGAPSRPNFTGYRPTVLPVGVQLTDEKFIRYKTAGLDYWDFDYSFEFNTSDLRLYERQKSRFQIDPLSCRGIGNACQVSNTPNGVGYRVTYSTYQNRVFGLTVVWIRGNTIFYMPINTDAAPHYLHYDWTKLVDSMQPVDLSHIPFERVIRKQGGA